jgi:hypothetical protein
MLGSFELMEEVINSVFGKYDFMSITLFPSVYGIRLVFIIRFAERRIDQLLDDTILIYAPLGSESETIQFESEWSFLRPFSAKRKGGQSSPGSRSNAPSSPSTPHLPISPSKSQATVPSSASRGLSSLRQTLSRVRGQSTSLYSLFQDSSHPSPLVLISFLTSLHTLLVMSNINPVIITQLWSQVMYWTSCR